MNQQRLMRLALALARRGYGATSPNPMVGAVLVKKGRIIGRGWHRRAGEPHAEIEAMRDAERHGHSLKGATLFVTLEPCCTHGRTPPCTQAIIEAGIKQVIVGSTDPNPAHCGKAFSILERAGISVTHSVLGQQCERLNEAFNHWIVHRTPFVTVKAAMTLDGKIATATGESKWITGPGARAFGMRLRQGADAILVGVKTILADDPSLTVRRVQSPKFKVQSRQIRRIVLDSGARTPLNTKIITDEHAALTTIVISEDAPHHAVAALAKRVRVLTAQTSKSKIKNQKSKIPLPWLLKQLGSENITHLLVEGGGEVNASFLMHGLAHQIAFFYAPKILGGRDSVRAVGGLGASRLSEIVELNEMKWRKFGKDLLLEARVQRA